MWNSEVVPSVRHLLCSQHWSIESVWDAWNMTSDALVVYTHTLRTLPEGHKVTIRSQEEYLTIWFLCKVLFPFSAFIFLHKSHTLLKNKSNRTVWCICFKIDKRWWKKKGWKKKTQLPKLCQLAHYNVSCKSHVSTGWFHKHHSQSKEVVVGYCLHIFWDLSACCALWNKF